VQSVAGVGGRGGAVAAYAAPTGGAISDERVGATY